MVPPIKYAEVAEQADAQDLKSCGSNIVPVRFRSSAPRKRLNKAVFFDFLELPHFAKNHQKTAHFLKYLGQNLGQNLGQKM